MSKNMMPRICKICGAQFVGGPRAWHCQTCRAERRRQQNRDFKIRQRNGKVIPVGCIIKCELCGADIIKTSGSKRFCEECAEKHLKQVDNEQSQKWKAENKEKYIKAKRDFGKKRSNEKGQASGCKYISWDKERRKWRVSVWDKETGSAKNIGRFADLEDAKECLDKCGVNNE